LYGSIERFIGILIENYAGAFPTWLAPVQVEVMNITDSQIDYVNKIVDELKKNDIRVESDIRNEKIGYKIRETQMQKVPYMIIVGDKEMNEGNVSVRSRKDGDIGTMSLSDFISKIKDEINTKSNQ
jgi:threonyl-tRNA synthetase